MRSSAGGEAGGATHGGSVAVTCEKDGQSARSARRRTIRPRAERQGEGLSRPHPRQRHRRRRPSPRPTKRGRFYDAALAVVSAGFNLLMLLVVLPVAHAADPALDVPTGGRLAVIVTVAVLGSLSGAVRRSRPLVPAALAVADTTLQGSSILLPASVYTLVMHSRRRWAAVAVAAGLVLPWLPLSPVFGRVPADAPWVAVLVSRTTHSLIMVGVPLLVAWAVRGHRLHISVLHDQAQRLKREQELLAYNAALKERVRLARDLHDVVAHYIGLIVIQAGTLEVGAQAAGERTGALIGGLGRRAMTELRDLVDVLRDPAADSRSCAGEGWLRDIAELVERVRQAQVDVSWRTTGELPDAGAAAYKTLYRAAQEGLSNAMRHASGSWIRLEVTGDRNRLELTVCNGPPAVPTAAARLPSGGRGLAGALERVNELGGHLNWARTPDGGFRMHVSIPAHAELQEPHPTTRQTGTHDRTEEGKGP
ncbi:sensor histidine kinase [Streptomyces sp. NBC_01092]|uniref:sensor histidine kinase n=1 Tax=Streptomyces sp. NBC_01092 TaxID=2903748 RepID=UPI003864F392|nr:histidine kinase [Streptomyces sp. NBC_01092]